PGENIKRSGGSGSPRIARHGTGRAMHSPPCPKGKTEINECFSTRDANPGWCSSSPARSSCASQTSFVHEEICGFVRKGVIVRGTVYVRWRREAAGADGR